MASGNDPLCLLCHCMIWDKNTEKIGDTTKEILDVIFVNKNVWLNKEQPICQHCSRKIQDSFSFKCSCIYVEDFLLPFVTATGTSKVDLKEVYMKQYGSGREISDNWKVCRLCLQVVNGYVTSVLEQTEFDMIQKYMPEITIHNTLDPVACGTCIKHLHNFAAFINDCMDIQQGKTREYEKETAQKVVKESDQNVNNKYEGRKEKECTVSVSDFNFNDKNGDMIQGNFNRSTCELRVRPQTSLNYKNSLPIEDDDRPSVLYDLDLHMVKNKEAHDDKKPHETETKDLDFKNMYQAALKEFEETQKVKIYYCVDCDYETKYPNALKSHMLNHKDPSQIEMYKCDKCDYKTKYRNALKSHKLNHKSPEEIKMRKCDKCSYETKHRTALVLHMLKHKKPSEIQMYKCDKCEFQTKFKHALKPHKQKHKEEK